MTRLLMSLIALGLIAGCSEPDLPIQKANRRYNVVVIVSDAPLSLVTTPSPAKVGVGQTFQAELVNIKDDLKASLLANDHKHLSYKSTQPVTYLGKSEELSVTGQ